MRTIRASEISSFIFCQRAWWYQRQGVPPINRAELAGGSLFHQEQVRAVRSALFLRMLAWVLLVAAVAALLFLLLGKF